MRVRVKLPKIGMTMEEATIVRFCRQPGEAFRKGDPLYEIETEKISQEVEATDDGMMVEHLVPEGADVRVGDAVCVVTTNGISQVPGSSPASEHRPGVRGSSPASEQGTPG